ncbi:MAG: DUF1697 domain-containing protein [Acidimicrobiales bacterium]|nr:DUF1697 domain-containing protein [Acidimicrobiales bacterium]
MTVMVALLRGVNVGGRSSLSMADLREMVVGCGFEQVSTYIQSGNVVFVAPAGASPVDAESRLHDAVALATGLSPQVVVRTAPQLVNTVRRNPFSAHKPDGTQLHVGFVSTSLDAPKLETIPLSEYAPESATVIGHDLYLYLPDGMGRSKLASAIARLDGATMTLRNWRTVTTLTDMARRLESEQPA